MSSACVCHIEGEWCFYCEMYKPLEDAYRGEKERADRNEYAHSQVAVMTDNWAYEKERADRLQSELSEYVEDNWKAFEREQQLRKAIEEALSWTWNCGEDNMNEVITILKTAISSLYPLPEKEIGI